MKMPCIGCSREVNLDHVIFQNYEGPVKCFSCGAMMEVRTTEGMVHSVAPLGETAACRENVVPAGNFRHDQRGELR
jgi:ribosomal protein S27E